MDDTVPDEQTERPAGPPSLDLNDPLAKSLVTTEPGSLNPNWTVADSPEPEVAQSRMQDFLRAHAIAHRSFDEVQSNWKNSFGDVKLPDQDAYKSWQDRADREGLLDRTRAQAATEPIRSGPLDLQNSRLNQVGMGFGFMQKRMYNAAKERFDAGEPTGQDYGVIANYERTQALQQQDEQGGEGRLRSLALGAPAMIAQMHLAAPAIGGVAGAVTPEALAGASGLTAGAARLGIRAAAMNAVVPGMGPEAAIEGFSDNGVAGAAKGFAKSFGRAVVMEASFGTAGKLSEKLGGLAGAAFGALGATVAQQGVDAVNYATGLSPRYGAFQDFREGKKGEAAAEAVMGFLTNVAIVGASHPEAAKAMAETFKKAADANYGRGQTPGKGLADAAEKAQEAGRQIIETAAQNGANSPNAAGAAPPGEAQTPAGGPEVPPSEATGAQPAGNAAPAGKSSTWLTEAIDRHNQDAERAGVADLIEQRAGEGAIGATIVQEIKPKLAAAGMDPADARTIVNAVRSRRGIPSQDDTAEFAKWQGEWRQRQAKPPEEAIRWKQPIGPDEPPVPDGMIRMYHGGVLGGKGGRDFTPDRTYAEGYAAKTPGAEVGYIDLPRNSPLLSKAFDDTGTSSPAPPVHLHAPADLAESMKPLKGSSPTPEPPQFAGISDADVLAIAKATGVKATKGMSRADAIAKMSGRTPSPAERSINQSVAANPPQLDEETASAYRRLGILQPGEVKLGKPDANNRAPIIDHEGKDLGSINLWTKEGQVPTVWLSSDQDLTKSQWKSIFDSTGETFAGHSVAEFIRTTGAKEGRVQYKDLETWKTITKDEAVARQTEAAKQADQEHDSNVRAAHEKGADSGRPRDRVSASVGEREEVGRQEASRTPDASGVDRPAAPAPEAAKPTQPPVPPPAAQPAGVAPGKMHVEELHQRLLAGGNIPGLSNTQTADLRRTILEGKSYNEAGAARGVTKQAAQANARKAAAILRDLVDETSIGSPENARRGPVDAENLPTKWAEHQQVEKANQSLVDLIRERQDAGVPLTETEADRFADLSARLDDAHASGDAGRIRKSIADAAAFVEQAKASRPSDVTPEQRAAVPPDPAANAGGVAAQPPVDRAAPVQSEGGGLTPEPSVPKRPIPPFEREWRKKAAEAGLSYDDLKAGSDQVLAENAGKVDEHNEIVRRAMMDLDVAKVRQDKLAGKLKPTGFNWASVRALAGEDHNSVFAIDDVADNLAEVFNRPDLDPEKLFDMLREGIRRPLTKTEAHQAALDEWNAHQEAKREAESLHRKGADPSRVRENLQRGQEAGEVEAAQAEGDARGEAHEPDPDDIDHGLGLDFDPGEFGKPLSDAERANFPGGGQPDAGEGRRLRNTALANAQIDQERALQKLPPILSAARLANPEVWDKAMARIAADPLAGDKLVRELAGKTRPTSVEENALLLWQKVANANEYRRVVGQYVEAMKPGGAKDAFDLDGLEKREAELASQRDMIDDVARKTGTEWGRAGQFRKQLAAEDFSLAGMLQALRGAKGSKPPTPEEIAQVHALQQKIEGLQKQLADAEAAFAGVQKPTAAAEIVKMPELKGLLAAQTAEAGARGEFREILGKARADRQTFAQSFIDTLIKLRVNEVISSPTTLAKIAAASAERFIETPANEAVGAILSRLPGLARIAALAPREGRGFNLGAEKQAAYQGLTQGVVDAFKKITTGRSDLDVLHGKNDVPRGWLDLQFGLHDGLKAPAERAEYTRSMLQRMDAESAAGKDPTTPAALLRISGEAFRDAQAAKFRQDNALVDIYNRAVGTLRASENPALNAVGVAARLLVPVVRVPTNLAMEVGNYAFGTGLGSARLVRAWMNGIENLKPEQADLIMRNFKKGSLGAALLAVGYFNPQSFGGYYAGKRDERDVKAGSIRFGGVDIPAWLLHNPAVEVMQMGATVRRASDKIYKHQEQGTGVGIGQGLAGWVEGIPLAREATDLSKAISPDPKERGRWLGETAKSFAVPQFVQWIAGRMDLDAKGEPQKRKPQGVIQTVETGVPGLRQRVPAGR